MPKVLCVAEKPSISKAITGILSGGQYRTVSNYDLFPVSSNRNKIHFSETLGVTLSRITILTMRQLVHNTLSLLLLAISQSMISPTCIANGILATLSFFSI